MSLKVLLADSSGLLKEVLSFSMAEKQIEFVAVETGTDALLQVKDLFPDVILADIALPGVDGYNLCEMVKKDSELSSRVVLLFDSLTPVDETKAKAAGYDHALKKPFNAEVLTDLFAEWGLAQDSDDNQAVDDAEDVVIEEEVVEEKPEREIPAEVELSEVPMEEMDDDERSSLFEIEPGRHSDEEEVVKDPFNPDEVFQVSDRDALLESSQDIMRSSAYEEGPAEDVISGPVAADQEAADQVKFNPEISGSKGKELLQEIVKHLSDDVVREVAWEVVPDLAERMIKEAIGKITKR
jgi:CheY-like chemotaxis protein